MAFFIDTYVLPLSFKRVQKQNNKTLFGVWAYLTTLATGRTHCHGISITILGIAVINFIECILLCVEY
jgi:hypothetical protein